MLRFRKERTEIDTLLLFVTFVCSLVTPKDNIFGAFIGQVEAFFGITDFDLYAKWMMLKPHKRKWKNRKLNLQTFPGFMCSCVLCAPRQLLSFAIGQSGSDILSMILHQLNRHFFDDF